VDPNPSTPWRELTLPQPKKRTDLGFCVPQDERSANIWVGFHATKPKNSNNIHVAASAIIAFQDTVVTWCYVLPRNATRTPTFATLIASYCGLKFAKSLLDNKSKDPMGSNIRLTTSWITDASAIETALPQFNGQEIDLGKTIATTLNADVTTENRYPIVTHCVTADARARAPKSRPRGDDPFSWHSWLDAAMLDKADHLAHCALATSLHFKVPAEPPRLSA